MNGTAAFNVSDAPSGIDLASTVGTWVAALLALIAIVGLIGPWLAIRAAFSDRNRALNGVYDAEGRFVSRGFPFTRHYRIFRTVTVPNLAPAYEANDSHVHSILTRKQSSSLAIFTPPSYVGFNRGWLKLCLTLNAYTFIGDSFHGEGNKLEPTRDGILEIVDKKTALVISKHWILAIGLLGRYQGEGISSKGTFQGLEHRPIDWEEQGTESESNDSLSRLTLGEAEKRLTIRGLTGEFRSLGRERGSWYNQSTISYIPSTDLTTDFLTPPAANAIRIGPSSLKVQFLLAFGLLPASNPQHALLLDHPTYFGSDISDAHLTSSTKRSRRFFKLGPLERIPLPLFNSMNALNLDVLVIQSFQEDRSLRRVPFVTCPTPTSDPGLGWKGPEPRRDSWLSFDNKTINLFKPDIEQVLKSFLELNWDVNGHLMDKSSCQWFSKLLRNSRGMLDGTSEGNPHRHHNIREFLFNGEPLSVFDWRLDYGYHALKAQTYAHFAHELILRIGVGGNRHILAVIGALFILHKSLRDYINHLIALDVPVPAQPASPDPESGYEADVEPPSPRRRPAVHAAPEQREESPYGMYGSSLSATSTENERRRPIRRPSSSQSPLPGPSARPRFESHPGFCLYQKETGWALAPLLNGEVAHNPEWVYTSPMPCLIAIRSNELMISAQDVFLIGLWTSIRAQMWFCSPDPRPLRHFHSSLTRFVYVT